MNGVAKTGFAQHVKYEDFCVRPFPVQWIYIAVKHIFKNMLFVKESALFALLHNR